MIDIGKQSEIVFLVTTEADFQLAEDLGEHLLKKRLAACISLKEVQSHYWWKGTLEKSMEIKLSIKTSRSRLNELLEEIKKRHSYELPEIAFWSISVSQEYKEWVDSETSDQK